jgi:class 3 adenylate cyclase
VRKRTKFLGILFILIVVLSVAFKNLHLPGSGPMLGLAVIFTLAFVISYIVDKLSLERTREAKISHIVLSLALLLVILSGVLTLLRNPAAQIVGGVSLVAFSIYLVFFTRHFEGRKLRIQKDRQLASILFTDIVGFTEKMGMDEDATLAMLDSNRTIQKKLIRKFRGRWIKEMGDGSMAIFYTASEALQCAIAIQEKITSEQEFHVRMGIHISEILFTDQDIFGDGVNVASRICSQAGPKQIIFSEFVFQNIKNREDLNVEHLGRKELKNVSYPLDLYGITC